MTYVIQPNGIRCVCCARCYSLSMDAASNTTVTESKTRSNTGSGLISSTARNWIYDADGCTCVYCGRAVVKGGKGPDGASLDHVIAHNNGGTDHPTNLVTACISCNSTRQDSTIREFRAFLASQGVDVTGLVARIQARQRSHWECPRHFAPKNFACVSTVRKPS